MLALLAATLLAASEGPIDGARPSTFALELQTGSEPPIGLVSLSAVYGPVEWLSLGAGIGTGERQPNYGLFARWYPLRRGAFKLGPSVGATRGERRRYSQPRDFITWTWEPMYRLDVGVGVEAKSGRLKARLESGVGFLLGEPVCLYLQGVASEGSCRSPSIPEQFHEAPSSVRMPVYLALSLGLDLQPSLAAAAPGADGQIAGETWYGGWAVGADLASAALTGLGLGLKQPEMVAVSALTYLLGAPINHLAHHQRGSAGASIGLRLAGALASVLALAAVYDCGDGGQCYTAIMLIPLGPLVAMIVDDAIFARAAVTQSTQN